MPYPDAFLLNAPPLQRRDWIAGLEKGLTLLQAFDEAWPRLTASQAGQRCGMTRTVARRLLLTLAHLGFVATDGKLYWLTPRVLRLGQGYLDAARLPRLVRSFLQQLSASTGETANVSVLDGAEVVYVARSPSPRLVSIGFQPGDRAPAHVVSPGRVLLSMLKDAALQAWIEQHPLAAFTPATVTERETFVAEVRAARRQGHWIADGQLDAGLTGLAVPLKDRRGRCVAALGMTVQRLHWTPQRLVAELLPALQASAQSLRNVL